MPVNPQSPKKKARENKKRVVEFFNNNEEAVIDIDGKKVHFFNREKVLDLIEQAKKFKPEDSELKVVTVCNACGVEDGHAENCEFREKDLPN